MTSKKTAESKRATIPCAVDYAKPFFNDWLKLSRSGHYDLRQLKDAMLWLIANDAPLPPEWLDHPLRGDLVGYRECHIGGGFLLIYELDDNRINFVRAGTHAELFNK